MTGGDFCQQDDFYIDPANKTSPRPLLLSESSFINLTWDIPAIPYNSHNNDEEALTRQTLSSLLYGKGSSPDSWSHAWSRKRESVFFIGRNNDPFRLQVACEVNVLEPPLSRKLYISDAGEEKRWRNNCTEKAAQLQRELGCIARHICRPEPVSADEWQKELLQHKYALDLPGIGPWSARLRLLLLAGSVIFQQTRSFEAAQFYDLLLKRNGVLHQFSTSKELVERVKWFRQHDQVARRIALAGHTFAWHCLTREGIRQFLMTWLRRLGRIISKGRSRQ
ncbi:unnamed protein product [Vitrella brassicaformis CCMP3155]|uniref:Glycosyl transferase CAP10 domain-containing protein n=1 Tax=Vitrella brassicaformis (strain CCMP3155) TaxID=1169540 RepID=A0A0G4EEE7_VITBC|nr:unnamed protein product [Vitrella brassicaformis CCMP3155]|eukprot:CEL94061.1 unnamed protein product [Vitrella brassicaformis CCMP3155]